MYRGFRLTVIAVLVAVVMLVPAGFLLGHPGASSGLRAPTAGTGLGAAATTFLSPYWADMAASLVLGQTTFTGNAADVTATNLSSPNSIAVDASGDVWVDDIDSNRVLGYTPPITVGEAASIVIGQPSFTTSAAGLGPANLSGPAAIAIDPHGDLWVSNFGYDRVLEFVPPFFTGMDASIILGQSSFSGDTAGTSATNFSGSNRMAFDAAGDLWISDSENNRVLEFKPPFTDGMAASVVIGQSTFTANLDGLTAENLSFPIGVAVSSTMLWVGDASNHRILGYPAPFKTGEAATVVLGQPNFVTNTATGPNETSDAVALAIDGSGDLWEADYELNRVCEFVAPIATFAAPKLIVGQSSPDGTSFGTSATNLSAPTGVAIAPDDTVWVADSVNNRALGYVPPTFALAFAETGLPSGTAWSASVAGQAYPSTTAGISVPEVNGTYAWSVGSAPAGYRLVSAASGTVTVNGSAPSPIPVTYAAVTYSVSFTETGLPTGTNWTVTVGSHSVSSTTTTITLNEPNGSYAYSVSSNATGYAPFPASGDFLVNSGAPTVQVLFTPPTPVSTPVSTSNTGPLVEGLIIGLVIGLIVGAVVMLLVRRRPAAPATVAPWPGSGAPSGPSSGAGAPPPPPPGSPPPPPGAAG